MHPKSQSPLGTLGVLVHEGAATMSDELVQLHVDNGVAQVV